MQSNILVGTLSGTRDLHSEVNGEKFYKTSLTINGVPLPIVASEYVLKNTSGKCRVHCVLKQDVVEESNLRVTYLYAAMIENIDASSEDINSVHVGGRIVKIFPPKFVGTLSVEELTFKVVYHMHGSVVIVNVSALGKNARVLSQAKRNNVLNATCYLTMEKDSLKLNVIDCDLRETLRQESTEDKEKKSNKTKKKKKKYWYYAQSKK